MINDDDGGGAGGRARRPAPGDGRPSRRTFLGGAAAAAAIGLPFLSSLDGRRARAAACAAPLRFMACYVPCGIHMPDWTPATAGTDWTMPYILAPLEPIRNKILVMTGLDHHHTAEPAQPPGGHASGTGAFLTMRPVYNNAGDPGRTSLDQVIAQQMSPCAGQLPSLQLGLSVANDGGSDGAPSTAFNECISWSANTPLSNITSLQTAFDRIFAGFDPAASGADAQRRAALRASVLDHAVRHAQSLQLRLDAADRHKLDEYLTSVRAVETRIQSLSAHAGTCAEASRPVVADDADYPDRLPVMFDLAALAFQCDVTRVITFMMARGTSLQDYKFLLGVSTPHHTVSHHKGVDTALAQLREIGRWELEQYARFLQKLDGIAEADGRTVLDNSVCYFSSEISDGNSHKKFDMPTFLAGNLGGTLKVDGRHLMFTSMDFPRPLLGPAGGPHTETVFVAIANAFGIPLTTFGDGAASGPMPELAV
jgi:Protein of unknown function (DUF1552)